MEWGQACILTLWLPWIRSCPMARKPRVEFPGALYHVIARGNRRERIFHDDQDYAAYVERLERYRRRDNGTLYAYVLMANHVHLLLETGAVPLTRTMQTLQFTYSQYYNRRYGTTGHVFQGRYKAILCDQDAYLLELVRYLHLNPARLRTPINPWRYRWSSHRAYMGESGSVQVASTSVLEHFHRQLGPARQAYRRFMKEGLPRGHDDRFYETVDQRFLGDERFLDTVAQRTASPVGRAPARRIPFGTLLTGVAQLQGVSPRTCCPRPAAGDRSGPCTAGVRGPRMETTERRKRLQEPFRGPRRRAVGLRAVLLEDLGFECSASNLGMKPPFDLGRIGILEKQLDGFFEIGRSGLTRIALADDIQLRTQSHVARPFLFDNCRITSRCHSIRCLPWFDG